MDRVWGLNPNNLFKNKINKNLFITIYGTQRFFRTIPSHLTPRTQRKRNDFGMSLTIWTLSFPSWNNPWAPLYSPVISFCISIFKFSSFFRPLKFRYSSDIIIFLFVAFCLFCFHILTFHIPCKKGERWCLFDQTR